MGNYSSFGAALTVQRLRRWAHGYEIFSEPVGRELWRSNGERTKNSVLLGSWIRVFILIWKALGTRREGDDHAKERCRVVYVKRNYQLNKENAQTG